MSRKKKVSIFELERRSWAKQMITYERITRPIFRAAINNSVRPVKEWMRKYGVRNVPVALLIDKTVWYKAYQNIYKQIGARAARREFAYQRKMDGIDVSEKADPVNFLVDVWTKLFANYASQYAIGISNELNDTTVKIITRALGKDYGIDVDENDLIRLIERQIDGTMKVRTNMLNRTESTTIANLGKEVAARKYIEETGEQGYRMWLGKIINERPEHLEVNNTIIPMNETYIVGGEVCMRPGDVSLSKGMRINCQCTQSLMSAGRYRQYVKRGMIVDGKVI